MVRGMYSPNVACWEAFLGEINWHSYARANLMSDSGLALTADIFDLFLLLQ